jgi:hypothetical protein
MRRVVVSSEQPSSDRDYGTHGPGEQHFPEEDLNEAALRRTVRVSLSRGSMRQRPPALAPGTGTGTAAHPLCPHCLHTPAGTLSPRIAEQTTDLQPAVSRQRPNPAGDRPRSPSPWRRDRLLQRAPYLGSATAASSSCSLRSRRWRAWLGTTLAGSPPATPFFFPSKCSAVSSAVSSSPNSRMLSAKPGSSSTVDSPHSWSPNGKPQRSES